MSKQRRRLKRPVNNNRLRAINQFRTEKKLRSSVSRISIQFTIHSDPHQLQYIESERLYEKPLLPKLNVRERDIILSHISFA